MLSLTQVGYPTTYPWAPLGGLGDYTETATQSGSCAGADFRCGVRPEDGNTFSCRPCTFEVLDVFKSIQIQLNRMVLAKRLSASYLLLKDGKPGADGRIGVKTVSTMRAVQKAYGRPDRLPAGTEAAARFIAVNAEEIEKELSGAADASGAPEMPSPGVKVPPTGVPGPATPPTATPVKKSKAGLIIGGLAAVTAVGLVAAAKYSKRRR